MTEQSVEHFTRFTVKYCLKTWQEQHEGGQQLLFGVYYLQTWTDLYLLNLPKKIIIYIIDMNLHRPRLACFRLFLNLELFWMNIIKQLLNSAFVEYEEFCRSWRVLSTKADNSDPLWSTEFFISYSALFNIC